MSVLLETSKGEIVIDLFPEKSPNACFNFIKLCQMKFYNNALFKSVQKDHIAQISHSSDLMHSIWSLTTKDPDKIYFEDEYSRKFNKRGLVATANLGPHLNSSPFFITLTQDGQEIAEFKNKHTVFGIVAEGLDVLDAINQVYTNKDDRPI